MLMHLAYRHGQAFVCESAQKVFALWSQSTEVTEAQDVAEAVWRAANDPTSPMRIVAGADAITLLDERVGVR